MSLSKANEIDQILEKRNEMVGPMHHPLEYNSDDDVPKIRPLPKLIDNRDGLLKNIVYSVVDS